MNIFNGNIVQSNATTVNLSVTAVNISEAYDLINTKIDQVMNEDVDYVVQSMEIDEADDGKFTFKSVVKVMRKTPAAPEPPKPVPQNPMGEIKKLVGESEDQDSLIPEVFTQNADLAAAFKNFKKREDNG